MRSWRQLVQLWRRGRDSKIAGSSDNTRVVHCNDRGSNEKYRYPNNKTTTRKYTWINFLPLALFLQYRRAAYWYFTAIALLTLTPFSPHSWTSIFLPLVFVVGLGVGREFWEDRRRSIGDQAVNSTQAQVLVGKERLTLRWKDLQVGDLVLVTDGEYFPADLLLLSSSGLHGVCYVETKNLDGETNLKARRTLESTLNAQYDDEISLEGFRADVSCEAPNASLYTFTGHVETQDGHSFPVGPAHLLLRDSSLQNTGHIWGVVIYAGPDTKVMQNSTHPPSKRSRLDKSLDRIVYTMFAVLFLMSVISGLVLGYRTSDEGPGMWYLAPFDPENKFYNPKNVVFAGMGIFVNGLILYGYLVPIGLYITLEIVRGFQGISISMDMAMREPSIGAGAKVRTTGLNEELGQVDTILSDKTGTLTCNQMDFSRCSIAGVSYGTGVTEVESAARLLGIALTADVELNSGGLRSGEDGTDTGDNSSRIKGFNFSDPRLLGGMWAQEANPDVVQLFFRILALCHTAIPEGKVEEPHSMRFRAESPDEAALVVAAKQFGFCFCKRTPSALHVRESFGKAGQHIDQTYELLNVLEFSSARKRMSVIVRYPDGRVMLLSKGADSVIFQRADPEDRRFLKSTLDQLKTFAEVGLRTLVLAYRELHEDELRTWQLKYAKAASVIGPEREERIEEVVDEIEKNLRVIGGTGVEDKLQDGVPETINNLSRAGINIWVLTGDKVETAINVGYACSLLRKGMHNFIISLEASEARLLERAEKENLSHEEVKKELKSIVAQQLSDCNREIEIMRSRPGHVQNSGEIERKSFSSESFSGSLKVGRWDFTPTHRQGPEVHELQEFTLWNSRQEIQEIPAKQELNRRGLRSQDLPRRRQRHIADEDSSFSLVIDGNSLAFVLSDDSLQKEFIRACKECTSVLCCRVSPRQKGQVTKLVRKGMGENKLCLAIGDGANDVGMIQAANVGVGIIGLEGAQAAMAADYAIAQFRFLERLLLVHGHWCYHRISLMTLYYYYKVTLTGWLAFCGNAFGFFSGQPIYNDWYASFYNTLFTALPVATIGILDQDVSAADSIRYPQLYKVGHRKDLFNRKLVALWVLNSVYTGLIIFFSTAALCVLSSFQAAGMAVSLPEFGAILFTCMVLVANIQAILVINNFTWVHHASIWGSIASWYIFLLIYGSLPLFSPQFGGYPTSPHRVLIEALGPTPIYWLFQILVVVAAVLPSFLFRCLKSTLRPSDTQIVSEIHARQGRYQPTSREQSTIHFM